MRTNNLPEELVVKLNRNAVGLTYENDEELQQKLLPQYQIHIKEWIEKIDEKFPSLKHFKLENGLIGIVGFLLYDHFNKHGCKNETQYNYYNSLHSIFKFKKPTEKRIEKVIAQDLFLKTLLSNEVFPIFGTFQKINRAIENITDNLSVKYRFISKVRSTELGNSLKFILILQKINFKQILEDGQSELEDLGEYLEDPDKKAKSKPIKEAYENLSDEYMSLPRMTICENLTPLENIQFLNFSSRQSLPHLDPKALIKDLPICFEFIEENKKGFASLLYDLLQIIWPEQFPTKEFLEEKRLNHALSSNDWRKHKLDTVKRYIDMKDVFDLNE